MQLIILLMYNLQFLILQQLHREELIPITVEKAVNGGSVNSTRTENDMNPVVLNPLLGQMVLIQIQHFAAAETTPTVYPARYYLIRRFSSLELNLTFLEGSDFRKYFKNGTTFL